MRNRRKGASVEPCVEAASISECTPPALQAAARARVMMTSRKPARRANTKVYAASGRSRWIGRIDGNWKQVTGKVKEQWGKLTDDDLTMIDGKREQR